MKILFKIATWIISNALAVYVCSKLVTGINLEPTLANLLTAGTLLGIVNTFIRPLVKLISLPLIILTLGIFTVLINIAMLFLVSYLMPALSIESLGAAFWGVLVISLVNYAISLIIRD